ncbi:histidine kinase N-terminal domain-containing protein|uniref:histidine kinase n=1 Tax=Dendrosporobacter quercicolus TaxID=146817 RepID=A0A1G9WA60_9FIRM|nr:histidine kinase N-terminal domain-containing protein [Dendrosporobacter quercicolus]NSL47671.1 histidine kinase N-terminal domain-containing protein [Dendrosporobacter quercicolus DSM 1736]SDM81448.1 Two-component sensor histidine kinase, contains HisKA and HATPase domains [Dendrosporobacter quercicolus]
MVEQRTTLRQLCLQYTNLAVDDISELEEMAAKLQFIAELTGTDIFIDALSKNGVDAIVLAWAYAKGNRSLYRSSVVGEMAYAASEPAVYQTFSTGKIARNIRGVSQEGVPIAQTVTPLFNTAGDMIGVLIMEKDISAEVYQEEQVEFLSRTAEHLSRSLMALTMTGWGWEEWLGNGIFVLNHKGEITYANKHAARLSGQLGGEEVLGKSFIAALPFTSLHDLAEGLKNPINFEFDDACYVVQAHPLIAGGELSGCVVSLQDVTELRQKERQLDMQSAIIQEINHRVKNTLQNVVSLLRLQMNRSKLEPVQQEFTACINRILSIARVHEVFAYQPWDCIDLQELAEYVLAKVVESQRLPAQTVNTQVLGQHIIISAAQAVPVGLVLNELVTNALKHGIKLAAYGEINVIIEQQQQEVRLTVSNDGCKPQQSPELIKNNKLGLYIVRLLICEQLGGVFDLRRENGATIAQVSFPLSSKEEEV